MVKATQVQNRSQFPAEAEPFTEYGPFLLDHTEQVIGNLRRPPSRFGTVPNADGETFMVRVFGTLTPNQIDGLKNRALDANAMKQVAERVASRALAVGA